jgi:malate dehydrogenase (oxaloacetate-decarboxylating)
MNYDEQALAKHKQFGGKITVTSKDKLDNKEQMSIYYTPGVAAVSKHLAEHPEETRDYTWTNNSVAVVSDGSAVLGLGNIGPQGALPVMEGKAMIFEQFAGISAVPIVLDVHTADEIVAAVKAIAPSFGGINLEDIAAPICFEVEERLKAELNIPVFHDDQHGTAIVVLAGLLNAEKAGGWTIAESKIVIAGVGSAGVAIADLLWKAGANHILMVDSKGVIGPKRTDLTPVKKRMLAYNTTETDGTLQDALNHAHIFIGVSKPNLIDARDVINMAPNPTIFALSNPVPEIMPDHAKKNGAHIVATGRSDFPNQVNNSLAFPGIFRGALDNRVSQITDDHKIAAAEAIAALVPHPTSDEIIPGPFTPGLLKAVAKVIV